MAAGAFELDLVAAQLVDDGAVVAIGMHGSRPFACGTDHARAQTGDEGTVRFGRGDNRPCLIVCQATAGESGRHRRRIGQVRV